MMSRSGCLRKALAGLSWQLVAVALLFGAATAGPSLLLVALLLRVVLGPEPTTVSLVAFAVGAPTLAVVGGWYGQPLVARLLRASESAPDPGNGDHAGDGLQDVGLGTPRSKGGAR